MERINLTTCNRKTLENLAIAGAFDSFGIAREQFVEKDESGGDFLDALIRYGTQYKIDQSQAQNSLFGEEAAAIITKPLPAPRIAALDQLRTLKQGARFDWYIHIRASFRQI